MPPHIHDRIAAELEASVGQVAAAVQLLDEGATVPFIARYRKERTGGLDDVQLRALEDRLAYLRELEDRRAKVLAAIEEQGKLTPELKRAIEAAETKTRLEDLYRPYMVKRRTKAQIARENGLAPLAKGLLDDPRQDPECAAAAFVDPKRNVPDAAAALEGARHILVESFAEDPDLSAELRDHVWQNGRLRAKVCAGKEDEGARFSDYFDYTEPLANVPSHRALALLRARKEDIVTTDLALDPDDARLGTDVSGAARAKIARRFGVADQGRPADAWLLETVRSAWRLKLAVRIELELMTRMREAAGREAIDVFARNLKALLLAAPAGPKAILGLDPGLRTGVKVAVVDATGKVLATDTIYPTPPRNEWERSLERLALLVEKFDIPLVSIGNGTGSRETDRLVADLAKRLAGRELKRVVVSEAGASVYSASELASHELPDLDVSLRGAASIARRLQDPLAELVKIEPKAIGVGQYQHDVNQAQLSRSLDAVIEDCVNAVGVDVNTASPALLTRVAGMSGTLAENLVAHRDEHGAFKNRRAILKVPRLGKKAFEQAAGFLRVMDGTDPLDRSAVHPEAYPVVKRIAAETKRPVSSMIGDAAFLRGVDAKAFTDEDFGLPTVTDILAELEKPGRDPRPNFETATFADGVEAITDLAPDMILEGVVSNVTNFGAFVDVGVHQDGLVHISQMSHEFVNDPNEVVRAGQVVRVKVMAIDLDRRRIALSMRLDDESREFVTSGDARGAKADTGRRGRNPAAGRKSPKSKPGASFSTAPSKPAPNAFARAFAELKAKERNEGREKS
ncbi:MAG: RNA-binding transcriptional accessory protein [bacterium]|nr:RNA-binding transcriptional accessory protein [bacterium]